MNQILRYPVFVLALSLVVLWLSAFVGTFYGKRLGTLKEDEREDWNVVQAATLTLLGLLIGFTFSMAISRYELRKNYEVAEANAIGTVYIRTGLLPAADAATVRELLRNYLDQRVQFYTTRDAQQLQRIDTDTAQLQNELWSAIEVRALAEPTPLAALAASGMNDVFNSEGYSQAAWRNRIPIEAWLLLALIAIGCNLLIGYGVHRTSLLLMVLPLAVSLSFFLIADIDSPRGGMIHVQPENLVSLSQSLHAH
jgi:hypothetical protein